MQQPKKGYDLGLLGVLIHVMGDAVNNIGVIISALVIWLTNYPARYYADPAVSMGIAFVIFSTSFPLSLYTGIALFLLYLTDFPFSKTIRKDPTRKRPVWNRPS